MLKMKELFILLLVNFWQNHLHEFHLLRIREGCRNLNFSPKKLRFWIFVWQMIYKCFKHPLTILKENNEIHLTNLLRRKIYIITYAILLWKKTIQIFRQYDALFKFKSCHPSNINWLFINWKLQMSYTKLCMTID